jgi:hypothetical protein
MLITGSAPQTVALKPRPGVVPPRQLVEFVKGEHQRRLVGQHRGDAPSQRSAHRAQPRLAGLQVHRGGVEDQVAGQRRQHVSGRRAGDIAGQRGDATALLLQRAHRGRVIAGGSTATPLLSATQTTRKRSPYSASMRSARVSRMRRKFRPTLPRPISAVLIMGLSLYE